MEHKQYSYIKALVEDNEPVLLEGVAGTGKTTIARHTAKDLGLSFFVISMTRQTTKNDIIGFISINGKYIPTQFRKIFEHGGLCLLDELDAGDPNTLLIFNTIENGFMSFPDGVINRHPDFRLIATANPQDQHNLYTGRSKLDAATLDRFEPVYIELDSNLEESLTSQESLEEITLARAALEDNNITKPISMRDSIRYHKRKARGLDDAPIDKLLQNDANITTLYLEKLNTLRPPPAPTQSSANTVDELWNTINVGQSDEPGKPLTF